MFTFSSVADFNKRKIKNIKYLIEKKILKINNCVLGIIVIKYYFNKL